MNTKETNQKYNDNEIIVAKSRNGIIKVNRIIAFLVIVGAIFGVIQWGWLPVLIVGRSRYAAEKASRPD